jgi:septal ring factor EnvC (AmiA/AmiB activator)
MNENRDRKEIPETGGTFRNQENTHLNSPNPGLNRKDQQEEETLGGTEELHLSEQQAHAFEKTLQYIEEVLSPAEHDAIQLTVTQIMVEAARGDNANEALLWKRLDDLRRAHPHVLKKLLDAINATGAGFPLRVRRVAERMSEQINNPSPDQETF